MKAVIDGVTESSEQMEARYAAEEEAARQSRLAPGAVPFRYEDITCEWLTAILCRDIAGTAVTDYQLGPVDNGTTNRRRIALQYNEQGAAAALPAAVFCKSAQRLENRLTLGPLTIRSEVNFYNLVRPGMDFETPVAHFARFNDSWNYILVMDDLSERAKFCTPSTVLTIDNARDQFNILATLHGRHLSASDKTWINAFPSWADFFGTLASDASFKEACERGFRDAEQVIPPEVFSRKNKIWDLTVSSLERHAHLPNTLCHNDAHLRNWYMTHDGRMGMCDYHVTSRSHWSRDLIYTMVTSLSVEDRRNWQEELLGHYHDRLSEAAGQTIDPSSVTEEIGQQLLTVLAFWTAALKPAQAGVTMHPQDDTLEMIRRITTAISDFGRLA
jgi:thiamine kinase-like enzyme